MLSGKSNQREQRRNSETLTPLQFFLTHKKHRSVRLACLFATGADIYQLGKTKRFLFQRLLKVTKKSTRYRAVAVISTKQASAASEVGYRVSEWNELFLVSRASCNSVRWAWESPGGCESFGVISIFFFFLHLSRTFRAFCAVTLKCLFICFWQVTTNCFTAFCKQLDSDIRRSSVWAEAFEMRWHQGLYCVNIYQHRYVSDSQKQEHFDKQCWCLNCCLDKCLARIVWFYF